jgi:ribosomal RNA assembly protein
MQNKNKKFLKKNFVDFPQNLFICKSIFSIIFPKYQEKKILESWKIIERIMDSVKIKSRIDLFSGSIQIWNTKLTRDPFALFNVRDFLRLITRGVSIEQAAKIFDDEIHCDIIKINVSGQNKNIFLKRRKRLIGKNGSTVKAIEMITETYLLIQGNTVSCMGKHVNLKQVRKIVEDCMKNIHPIYHIKTLIIKKELSNDFSLKKKSWNKYLPRPKKISVGIPLIKLNEEKFKKNTRVFSKKKHIFYEKGLKKSFLAEKKIPNINLLSHKIFLGKKNF